jgi:hypothetical protein
MHLLVLSQAYPAPVKLHWQSNAFLDLEGKPVSNWKLEEYTRREWESCLRIIHLCAVIATLFRGHWVAVRGLVVIVSIT